MSRRPSSRLSPLLLPVALIIFNLTLSPSLADESVSSADLPLEARTADSSSQEDDLISTSYVLPNQIFNDGKPYYASKDPISGQPDFNAKKTAGIETAANEVIDPKEKIVLTNSSPNIHDYLNLPVKYSSSKFVYPLVSSSYANLKYQGSNKNYMTNKKPTTVVAPVSPAPGYPAPSYSSNITTHYTVPTTKLIAVQPTAAGFHTTGAVRIAFSKPHPTAAAATAATTTASTAAPSSTTKAQRTSTTARTTTTSPITTPKYNATTRRPPTITISTHAPRVSTTRKKFVPTKKYTSTTSVVMSSASTPIRLPTQPALPTSPTTTAGTTTATGLSNSQFSPSASSSRTSTSHPIVFTEGPSVRPPSSHLRNSTEQRIPDLEPADVYQTLGQKNTEFQIEQKPSMTLADIFNSLAEEESAVSLQNQGNQGFDAQGNLMRPITLSRPSPFAVQQSGSQSSPRPTPPSPAAPVAPATPQQSHSQQLPPLAANEQKVISGSQENYSNEYVSYQVQQPNVMQYRPMPGAINNVVISPGQNSASFVLGSQQQVGNNAFASVEKEPLFSKEPPVQYGTVISEDISTLKRMPGTNAPQASNAFSQMPISLANSNYHQTGTFIHHATAAPDTSHFTQRPVAPANFHDALPSPPSPYQQLPLMGTQKHSTLQQQQQQTHSLSALQSLPPQQQQSQQSQQSQTNSNYQHLLRPQSSALQQQVHPPTSINISGEQETQELLVSTNIRFPEHDEPSEASSGPALNSPPAGPQVNGHAQPLSLQQIQQSNPVVFPKTNEVDIHRPPPVMGSVQNPQTNAFPYQNDVQIQKHEVLTMHQHKQKLNFPQNFVEQSTASASQHIPSQHMEPPPRFPQAPQQGPANNHASEQQKRLPSSNHPSSGPHSSTYKYTRKHIPDITRPNQDHHLPNILPQFRPNAKISSGHPSTYNLEPGNIHLTANQPPKRPNSSPQFAHRHQPVPQTQHPQRYPMKRFSEYPASEANRRVYRLPPYGGQQQPQIADRIYTRRPSPNGITMERHAVPSLKNERYKSLPQMPPALSLEKLAAFEEEDFVVNDPPQPLTSSKDQTVTEEEKLEPVVTLQMLQSQKKATAPSSLPIDASHDYSGSGEIQVNGEAGLDPFQNGVSQNGLYVVYPVRGETENMGANDRADPKKGTVPGFPHVEGVPTGSSEYQNTPFSVMRDQPQEPILMVKNKKPQSLQQQTKQAHQQAKNEKFPYTIEKPDPFHIEVNKQNRVPGVLIAPRIMNDVYVTGTSAPIAIAYTPTEPNPHNHQPVAHRQHSPSPQNNKYSNVNLASSVITEIRPLGTQTEEGFSNDFDLRGQNYEKDFKAPFYPSVSLGSAANTPSNGWNILPSSTDKALYLKKHINRADVADAKYETDTVDASTSSFELDNFQPELQGGFKPIYPPGYKVDEEPEEIRLHEGEDSPVALASRMESPMRLHSTAAPQISTKSQKATTPMAVSSTTSAAPTPASLPTTTKSNIKPGQYFSTNSSLTDPTSALPIVPLTGTMNKTTPSPTPTSIAPSTSTVKPIQRKKSPFETSLAALLFGEDEDFDGPEDGEARKESVVQAVSGPRSSNVPRSGPRNLKLS